MTDKIPDKMSSMPESWKSKGQPWRKQHFFKSEKASKELGKVEFIHLSQTVFVGEELDDNNIDMFR